MTPSDEIHAPGPDSCAGTRSVEASASLSAELSAREAGTSASDFDASTAGGSRHQFASVGDTAMDPWLLLAALALSCLGLVMVFSSSAWLSQQTMHRWDGFLLRQATFFFAGIGVMLAISRIDYRVLRRFAPQVMLISLVLLVGVLFLGRDVNGARRWIEYGPLRLQPSEIAKIALAIFTAATLARQGERVRRFTTGFLPVMAAASLTMILVKLENDLGTTILLGTLTLMMLFVAGTRSTYVLAALMLAAPLAWSQVVGVGFRSQRLAEFQQGGGYQVRQGLIAIGSGGPFGVGLGAGRQKLGHLPENHTDFILAAVGEELGFAGIAVVILLFSLLVWRGLVAAVRAPDRFGTYLALGISVLFGLQALINMAVVFNVIPAKGITLPFMSYGGSSLLISMASVGVLLSISRRPAAWRMSDQRGRSPKREHPREQVTAVGTRPNRRKLVEAA